jgi:polysaccharide pyruvyl transferase WcaK-like protein
LRLLVTARYHALCFALQLNIPFLAIESNTFKIQGLLKDIGIDNFRFVKKSDQLNFSKENLEKYFYFSNNELKKIKDYNNLAKIKINNLFDDISYIV